MGFLDSLRGVPSVPKKEEPAPAEELPTVSGITGAAGSGPIPGTTVGHSLGDDGFYNPYKGLQTALDTRGPAGAARTGFKIPERPEFVFIEESSVRRRGWSENLTYYTGLGYLSGAAMGGSIGAAQALTHSSGAQAPATARLKLNRLLNTGGQAGRTYGNTVGIVGLFFSASESLLFSQADRYGLPDAIPTLGAGFITGALYRIPRGPRPAVVAGLVGTAGAGLLLGARQIVHGL